MHPLHFYRFVCVCVCATFIPFTVHFIIESFIFPFKFDIFIFVLCVLLPMLMMMLLFIKIVTGIVGKNTLSYTQIKREPCQVSEITTSNSIQSIAGIQQQRRSGSNHTTPIIKIEAKSPTETTPPVINSISSSIVNMDQHSSNQVQSGMMNPVEKLEKHPFH